MESFFSRFKNALVLIAILLVQALALATQVRRPADVARDDGRNVRLVRVWGLALVTPVERLLTGTGHGARFGWSNYVDLRHVRQQNIELKKELDGMRLERAALAEDALEGQRLEKLMNFKQNYVRGTVVAQVIGTSASDAGRTLILNKGSKDGLKADMAVITPDGVVGKLRLVTGSSSQLLLLSDPSSGAGVILQSTRIRAIVKGSATGGLEIDNLTADGRIKVGDAVLTSGGDQVYPRGLAVGTIVAMAPDPEHQPYLSIKLKPAADLNRLDEVLVITELGTSLDAAAEGALAADAAGQHAADISAERLPSVHEGEAAGDLGDLKDPKDPKDASAAAEAKAPGEKSREGAPKPKPVMHPDQYSPGAAPPAAQLTPGGGH